MAFFNQAITVLQTLVIALGAGLGIWGVINLLNIGNQANSQKASAKYSKPEAQKIDIIKNVNVSFMP